MLTRLAAALLLGANLLFPAAANDGFGGMDATGLKFSATQDVAMLSEDLFISLTQVKVAYTFKNTSAADVTGEIIFPLPPISLGSVTNSEWNLPEDPDRPNLVALKAVVDGKPVEVKIDRIAVLEPEWVEDRPQNQQYDTPGTDVTAILEANGIPLSLDGDAVRAALLKATPEQRKALTEAKIAEYTPADPASNQMEEDVYPAWSIVERYHWTQTFKAGSETKIAHEYENRPSGGVFIWDNPETADDLMKAVAKKYCVDEAKSQAIMQALPEMTEGQTYKAGSAYYIGYVLLTANTWAGPIGSFKLTIDKGDPKNIVSFCTDGAKETGPTTLVVEKTNFTPTEDINILVVRSE